MSRYLWIVFLLFAATGFAGSGGKAKCVGGTNAFMNRGASGTFETADATSFIMMAHGRTLRIPYGKINLIEYGQNVSRRIALAILISPMFLLAKSRDHFVTLGYTDENGQQQ